MFGRKKIKELEERINKLERFYWEDVAFPPPMMILGYPHRYHLRDVVADILKHLNLVVKHIPPKGKSFELIDKDDD